MKKFLNAKQTKAFRAFTNVAFKVLGFVNDQIMMIVFDEWSVFLTLTTVVFVSMAFLISQSRVIEGTLREGVMGGGRLPLCIKDP